MENQAKEVFYYTIFKDGEEYKDFDSEKDAQDVMNTLSGKLALVVNFTDGTSERLDKPMDQLFNVKGK